MRESMCRCIWYCRCFWPEHWPAWPGPSKCWASTIGRWRIFRPATDSVPSSPPCSDGCTRLAAVFQQIEFRVVCATVFDEILFGPLRQGLPREEASQRTEQILDFCNIRRLVNRLPQNMSGGEKKIVAIAAMLAENPEVMIFDEPTNDLDLESQNWLVTALGQLSAAGKTVITATHSLETARELANRVWILGANHRLIADGGIELLQDREILREAGILR